MTQTEFLKTLETFEKDAIESNDIPCYSNSLMNLINDFFSEQIKKTPEQLASEMLEFVIYVRRNV